MKQQTTINDVKAFETIALNIINVSFNAKTKWLFALIIYNKNKQQQKEQLNNEGIGNRRWTTTWTTINESRSHAAILQTNRNWIMKIKLPRNSIIIQQLLEIFAFLANNR